MSMTFGQYQRIETAAGGIHCTAREFVKAARELIHDEGMGHEYRALRHVWLRSGLHMLKAQQHWVEEARLTVGHPPCQRLAVTS